jgi:two-component system, response regulator, stage 0 sporulation protein F
MKETNIMKKKYIVVCDDEQDNRDMVCHAVKNLGYETIELVNGREALDFVKDDARAYETTTMILDIKMPIMDGTDAVYNIRHSYTNNENIPILMLSAYEDRLLWNKLSGQVCGFLQKPLNRKLLAFFIEGIAEGRVEQMLDACYEYERERSKHLILSEGSRAGSLPGKRTDEELYEMTGGIEGTKPEGWDIIEHYKSHGF